MLLEEYVRVQVCLLVWRYHGTITLTLTTREISEAPEAHAAFWLHSGSGQIHNFALMHFYFPRIFISFLTVKADVARPFPRVVAA